MLIRNVIEGDSGYEGIMDFALFNCEIEVYFDDDVTIEYAEKCAEYLNNLSEDSIEKLCMFSIRYCEDYRIEEYEDEDEEYVVIPADVKSREIMQYIHPNCLIIPVPQNDNIAFHMDLECDWEPEHGMEWSVNNGEILYVGAFHDEEPWKGREFFKTASWNYVIFED